VYANIRAAHIPTMTTIKMNETRTHFSFVRFALTRFVHFSAGYRFCKMTNNTAQTLAMPYFGGFCNFINSLPIMRTQNAAPQSVTLRESAFVVVGIFKSWFRP
jgi:hypothetical protein